MKIGLVTILTDDVKPMERFYRDVLGFEVIEDLGSYVEFLNDGVRFAICAREVMHTHTGHESYALRAKGQSFELAFPVGSPEDVDHFYLEAVARGATPVRAPDMMSWGRKTGFISDPDGNIHEIYSLKQGETE